MDHTCVPPTGSHTTARNSCLLDVGSQILDLSNVQVATAWLKIRRDTAGAIYFSESDKMVRNIRVVSPETDQVTIVNAVQYTRPGPIFNSGLLTGHSKACVINRDMTLGPVPDDDLRPKQLSDA